MKVIGYNKGEVAKYVKEIDVCGKKIKIFKGEDDNMMFSLPSIAKMLGYGDANKSASLLSEERKKKLVIDSGNGVVSSWFVDVFGLVSIIIKSRKLGDELKLEFINNYFSL